MLSGIDYNVYTNSISQHVDWYKYVDCIYYISSSYDMEDYFIESSMSNGLNKVVFIKYILDKKFSDLAHFKEEAILRAMKDASKFNFRRIMIIPDSVKFIDTSIINKYIPLTLHNDITVLNCGDVAMDCVIISSNVLNYINSLQIDTTVCGWHNILKRSVKSKFVINSTPTPLCVHKIDFVFTYVNSEDKEWQLEYNKYNRSAEQNRFRDIGTLAYLLRGIHKYAPWINNVYMVVSSETQIPDWINKDTVKIVLHKDIIPEQFLPTFNSCTIEMFLPFIPGLSEYWIYSNDDMFVLNNIAPTQLFKSGKICTEFKNVPNADTVYNKQCINSFKLCMEDFSANHINKLKSIDNKYKKMFHTIHPFFKSTGLHLHIMYRAKIYDSISKFRTSHNMNQYIFGDYEYLAMNTDKYNLSAKYTEYNRYVENNNCETLCINDNLKDYNKQCIDNIIFSLYNKFKEPSKYDCFNIYSNSQHAKYSVKPSVALCAIAKNENLYIREWVKYYKQLGVDHIFIYDNNDLDGERFEDIINDFILSGYVEIINMRGIEKGCVYNDSDINLQSSCYIDCYENRAADYEYLCFFDIDEFLTFKYGNDFCSLFNTFYNCHVILVPWEHYDDNNLIYYDDVPVTSKFIRKSKIKYYGVKSIVKVGYKIYDKKLKNIIHNFSLENTITTITNFEIIDAAYNFNWITAKNGTDNAICVLNHYKTKTISEFVKRHLGRHWGTAHEHTYRARNIYDVLVDFYKYNYWNANKAAALHPDIPYKAIIAITSWKKRINIVEKTIRNIQEKCGPRYKIVLTLSYDEFPNRENELPSSLLSTNVEIIWVKRNYGCYKKVLFAMQKYPTMPIISADDDCLYKYDYASELFDKWIKNPTAIISSLKENRYIINNRKYLFSHGRASLFPPSSIIRLLPYIEDDEILSRKNDDSLYGVYAKLNNINIMYLDHTDNDVVEFSTNENSLTYEMFNNNKQKAKEKFMQDKLLFIQKLKAQTLKLAVCAIAKSENNYIREWVEHYKKLGFDNIILCDNNNSDGERFEDVIGDYISSGYVIVKNYKNLKSSTNLNVQSKAYTESFNEYRSKYDWMLFVDIDEFLTVEKYNIKYILSSSKFNESKVVRLCWKVYTDSNLIETPNDYSIKRFTEVTEKTFWRNKECKAFINCNKHIHGGISAHGAIGELNTVNILGNPCNNSNCFIGDEPIWEVAWINHYMTKTISEFIHQKLHRGDASNILFDNRCNFDYFFEINQKTEEKEKYISSTYR